MKTAFLFPGQGSQFVGMAKPWQGHPAAKPVWELAKKSLGYDLEELCLNGPAEKLQQTEYAQPAILTLSVIAFQAFQQQHRVQAAFAAGHSLGEYSALVAAGALSFEDAVQTVQKRGQFMQQATPIGLGAMAAILGLGEAEVQALCVEHSKDQVVSPANFNTPGQIVISGHQAAVDRVLSAAKGKKLAVSAPFHCSLMQPAADKLSVLLQKLNFKDAQFPIITNTTNEMLTKPEQFADSLTTQVTAAVRWQSGIQKMAEHGMQRCIEFGAGKVLTSMMRRIAPATQALVVNDPESLDQVVKGW